MIEELETYLREKPQSEYDRDGYDVYCAKRKLTLSCPVIHVSGSNGKSCLVHYLESIYKEAGFRVAAFLDPALYAVNESIRFDGKDIDDAALASLWKDNRKDFDKFKLSRFECIVALAYRYFETKKPDIAIIEVGMGGALDATNLDFDTRLAIITNICAEHTSFLGTTLSQIALHKAGIFKSQSPVLLGKMEEDCLTVLRGAAERLRAPLHRVEDHHFNHLVNGMFHFDYSAYKDIVLSSVAEYQLRNACLAIEAVRILQADFPVSEEKLRKGLLISDLPCRVERFGRIVLDGAHNPDAVAALARATPTLGRGGPVHVLFASLREKNIAVELPTLANVVASITLTRFDHPLAREEEDYFLYVGDHPYVGDAIAALRQLLEEHPTDTIVITGAIEFTALMRKAILAEGFDKA